MMHWLFFGYLVISTLLLVPFIGTIHWLYAKPDVYLLGIFFACLWFGGRTSLAYCLFCGVLKASFSGHGMFGSLLAAVLWWGVLVQLAKRITMDRDAVKVAVLGGMLFLQSFVVRPLVYQGKEIPLGIVLRTSSLELIYTVFLCYGLLRVCGKLFKDANREKEEYSDLEVLQQAPVEE